jgi:(1->4)-alpha-D-glucan 1-alpha-D-glucosylmutase
VLSEIPGAWKAAVSKWRTMNRRFKTQIAGTIAPDSNEEYLLYQTLVGSWPFEGMSTEYGERIDAYMIKALREAKVHTSWLSPDEPYENAVRRFAAAILDRGRASAFLDSFLPFERRVAELGIYNGLSQLLVKVTAPGVPDFYQGTELWDLDLVDPDNRRPVDYARRRRMLDAIVCRRENDQATRIGELLASRNDGRIKMFVMMRALAARRQRADVFAGEYLPLTVTGARRESLFAFARQHENQYAITCVPRLLVSVMPDANEPPLGDVWLDTRVELCPGSPASFRDVLSDATVSVEHADGAPAIRVADLFRQLPIALLVAPQ